VAELDAFQLAVKQIEIANGTPRITMPPGFMHWIAPSEKDTATGTLGKRLWGAGSKCEVRSARCEVQSVRHPTFVLRHLHRLPAEARFDFPLNRPEAQNVGANVNAAMRDIKKHNPQLAGVLPKTYSLLTSTLLKELLKKVSEIPALMDYDAFTRSLDPACGSGGMFVSSARFVAEHKQNPAAELSIHGVQKTDETGCLCRVNLAAHGLEGDTRHGGNVKSCYDEPHDATGCSAFVLANPPFNVNAVDTAMRVSADRHSEGKPQDLPERQDHERLKDSVEPGRRFPFGLPISS
jgi:type I restriction enzyme M protein